MRIFFLFALVFSDLSMACSYGRTIEEFQITNQLSEEPNTPDFIVASIFRGSNDGNEYSCSDAGVISLKLQSPPSDSIGYIFEIIEGEFEDELFYSIPIALMENYRKEGYFNFRWLDGSSKEQEPFNITVQIIAVSKSGSLSKPQQLQISHPGVEAPWWYFW